MNLYELNARDGVEIALPRFERFKDPEHKSQRNPRLQKRESWAVADLKRKRREAEERHRQQSKKRQTE